MSFLRRDGRRARHFLYDAATMYRRVITYSGKAGRAGISIQRFA